MYFSTYQSLAKDERRPGLFKEYAKDFFDLVIVDECQQLAGDPGVFRTCLSAGHDRHATA